MILPWDELNNIRAKVEQTAYFVQSDEALPVMRFDKEKALDIIYDYLVYAYLMGVDNVNEELSTSIRANDKEMRESIFKKIAGKDFRERVEEYADKGDIEGIMRVAETDAHRNMEDASQRTAKKAGAKRKRWNTMEDDRVREEHEPLDKIEVGIDENFVTWDGFVTDRPGNFGVPELDINCRCFLTYSY